jgi:hypothetical protein
VVELDAGFLCDLADSGLFWCFAVVEPASGEFPPVVARVVWVAGVHEQHAVEVVKE